MQHRETLKLCMAPLVRLLTPKSGTGAAPRLPSPSRPCSEGVPAWLQKPAPTGSLRKYMLNLMSADYDRVKDRLRGLCGREAWINQQLRDLGVPVLNRETETEYFKD